MISIEETVEDIEKITGENEIDTIENKLNHIYNLLFEMIGENDDHMVELINQIKKNANTLINFHY